MDLACGHGLLRHYISVLILLYMCPHTLDASIGGSDLGPGVWSRATRRPPRFGHTLDASVLIHLDASVLIHLDASVLIH